MRSFLYPGPHQGGRSGWMGQTGHVSSVEEGQNDGAGVINGADSIFKTTL